MPRDPWRVPVECWDCVFAVGSTDKGDKVPDFLRPVHGTRDQASPTEPFPRMSE